ncbi:NmrA family NAD(P)-binding protein [Nocardia fusca]|uniref:NmrA family NAD(P)-binding protein n=1 Tax=Nocardia fusca TaxID=941183 RepID=UPI000A01F9E1|nr:NmrA family NAD(P)-binding protein [Nocardia fusca]
MSVSTFDGTDAVRTDSDSPILVTGATGRQGGATARRLLAAGRPVRALVRDTEAPDALALAAAGARLVRGDFDDLSGLAPALEGVAGVFGIPPVALGPSGVDTELEAARGRALIDAAVAAGVEQVVFSTVASTSAPLPGGAGKRAIEEYLFDRVAVPTVLRPVRFMTNYLGVAVAGIDGISRGVHRHLFPPHEPMQIIAVEDIAEFALLAFTDPARFAGRTLELAGDQPTPVAAAAAISEATGIAVRYEQVTDDEAAALGTEIAAVRTSWRDGHRWHADIEALRVIHPGLRTFGDWLAEPGATVLRDHLTAGVESVR